MPLPTSLKSMVSEAEVNGDSAVTSDGSADRKRKAMSSSLAATLTSSSTEDVDSDLVSAVSSRHCLKQPVRMTGMFSDTAPQ